ncbi:hypothetical protein QTN25_002083 [Entamoeba marina]
MPKTSFSSSCCITHPGLSEKSSTSPNHFNSIIQKDNNIIKYSSLTTKSQKKRSKSVSTTQRDFQHTVYVKKFTITNTNLCCQEESFEDFEVRNILMQTKNSSSTRDDNEFEYERSKNPGMSMMQFSFIE